MGDRGYRGCEYVEVCESKEQKGIRQVVEAVNSQISFSTELAGEGILRLYLLTFRVILLGIVSSGSLGCLNNFSPEVLL
jgi:hypothetical protein